MQARASKKKASANRAAIPMLPLAVISALLSAALLAGMSTRLYLLMNYRSFPLADLPILEPLLAETGALLMSALLCAAWLSLYCLQPEGSLQASKKAIVFQVLASLPWALVVVRTIGIDIIPVSIWEPIWSCLFFGLSCACLAFPAQLEATKLKSLGGTLVAAASLLFAVWWYLQTVWYYDRFLLGFNDFGHFTQRLVNTSNGNGFLLETPVLPAFWDHFNPGLVVLVPLWTLFQSVHLVFILQAGCLALGGWLSYRLALALELDKVSSACVGIAFLLQPSLGQMNLAYTYGWHPVSAAIPLLFVALICLVRKRYVLATLVVAAAMTVEESVFVVVGCFAASCCIQIGLRRFHAVRNGATTNSEGIAEPKLCYGLSLRVWFAVFVLGATGFVLVYKLSGLEEFQTGRFVALGNSLGEIIASPLMKPAAFWGAVFKVQGLAYVVLLAMPCFLPSLFRGWKVLLTLALPLGVLIVWDHLPSTCLAFQYASTLLPFLWLGAIEGVKRCQYPRQATVGALATSAALSLFFSQLPYSPSAIQDVVGATYGVEGRLCRAPTTEAGVWLNEKVKLVRESQAPVLATGRIAAHLVGNKDVETVLQFDQRRRELNELDDRQGDALGYYTWVLLDFKEVFQQSAALTRDLEAELAGAGFELESDFKQELKLYRRDN